MNTETLAQAIWPSALSFVALIAWLSGRPRSRAKSILIVILTVLAYCGNALIAALGSSSDVRLALWGGWTLVLILVAAALRHRLAGRVVDAA